MTEENGTETVDDLRAERDSLREAQLARESKKGRIGKIVCWFSRLEFIEQIAFGILMVGGIVFLGFVAEITLEWLRAKAGHAISVVAYGLVGAFLGVLIAWLLNRVRFIRERSVPAADDSLWGITEWRRLRKAEPDSPWTMADAVSTLSACLRYGLSYLGIIVLTATGMLMAT